MISGLGARLMFISEFLDVFVCLGVSLVWIRGWSVWMSESVFGLVWNRAGVCVPAFFLWTLNLDQGLGWFVVCRVFVSGLSVFAWAGLTYVF